MDTHVTPFRFIQATSSIADGSMSVRFDTPEVVLNNRERFLAAHLPRRMPTVMMQVTHGTVVHRVDQTCAVHDQCVEAEALISDQTNSALLLLTADCVPLSLTDPVTGAFALVHVGWRPAEAGVVGNVIESLRNSYQVDPATLVATLGPSIHAASYSFDTVEQDPARWNSRVATWPDGTIHVDVPGYVTDELLRGGVSLEHITASTVDTAADPSYYSHYRSVRTGEREGRFMTVLAKVPVIP